MSKLPDRLLANASQRPSGDHAGSIWKKRPRGDCASTVVSVSRFWRLPSAFISKIA
jgi:hypothetical protein